MPPPEDNAAFEEFAQAMHEKYGEAFQADAAIRLLETGTKSRGEILEAAGNRP